MSGILGNSKVRLAVAAVMLGAFSLVAGPSLAGSAPAAIQPINPPAAVYSPQAHKTALRESLGIPAFDGTGAIGEVRTDAVIVDDNLLRFGAPMEYRSEATGKALFPSSFKPGVRVGWVRDGKGGISSLWMLEEQQ